MTKGSVQTLWVFVFMNVPVNTTHRDSAVSCSLHET
jgi:hypothetical protein